MQADSKKNLISLMLTVMLLAALTVFCAFVGYSLLIPFFLFFLALHLKYGGMGGGMPGMF